MRGEEEGNLKGISVKPVTGPEHPQDAPEHPLTGYTARNTQQNIPIKT